MALLCCRTVLTMAMLSVGARATAMGAVKLDNYTFDKLIATPGLTVMVKVDKSYAYGEKEDAFKALCKLAYPVKDLLIAEIPVQEYGDKENEDVATRLGVKTDEFPAYFLFKGSVESAVKFVGFPNPASSKPKNWDDEEDGPWDAPMIVEPTTENLVLWLRKNGIRTPSVGTIAELDEVAMRFLKEGLKDADIEVAKTLAAGAHKDDKKAPIYVKIMEKVKAKGEAYVQTELTRVEKLITGKISEEKKAELADKIKILNVFASKDL